jgi:O-antigen ligase
MSFDGSAPASAADAGNASARRSIVHPILPYLGLQLYVIASIVHPQDWWEPMRGLPLDYLIFALIGLGAAGPNGLARVGEALSSQQAKLILGYVAIAFLSIVWSGAFGTLGDRLAILLKLFVVFLGFASFARSARRIECLLITVVILSALVAYQGLTLLETGTGWAGQGMYWGGRIRWVGMYDGANVLCMLFAIALACCLNILIGPWGWLAKLTSVVSSMMIVYGVFLTKSRGGFLAVVVVVALTVLLRRTDRPLDLNKSQLALAAVAACLVLAVAPSRMDKLNDDEHSTAGRIDAWQEGFEMLRGSPLLGVGEGQWREHHFRLAHNSIVQTMGEVGILGLMAWLASLFACVKALLGVRMPDRSPQERSMATALLIGFAAFVSCSYFVTTTQFDLTFIFCGLAVGLQCQRKSGNDTLTSRDAFWVGVVAVVVVVAVYVTVRVFYATA